MPLVRWLPYKILQTFKHTPQNRDNPNPIGEAKEQVQNVYDQITKCHPGGGSNQHSELHVIAIPQEM